MSRLRGCIHGGWREGASSVALRAHCVSLVPTATEELHVGPAVPAMPVRPAAHWHTRRQRLQPEEELCAHRAARAVGAVQ